jgi:subtilisin family serine protease
MERREYLIFDAGVPVPVRGVRGIRGFEELTGYGHRESAGRPEPLVRQALLSEAEAGELRRSPGMVVVEPMPVSLVAPLAGEGDARNGGWGLDAIGATSATLTGAGVTVAVLDTGVDAAHPAFAGVNVISRDFTGTGEADTNGHGTHCAGTIVGRDVDGTRIGVARGVGTLLAGKVIAPGSTMAAVAAGIDWALASGAQVISMSLNVDFVGYTETLAAGGLPRAAATSRALTAYRDTISGFAALAQRARNNTAFGSPAILVAAAGNESQRSAAPPYTIGVQPPASVQDVVSVAALDRTLAVAGFSNTGASLAAPGVDITSAWPGGTLKTLSGTSMAAPHVAGVAALWYQKLAAPGGRVSLLTLTSRLIGTARPVDGLADTDGGAGLVTVPTD